MEDQQTDERRAVDWSGIRLFYGIALLGPLLAAGVLLLFTDRLPPVVSSLVIVSAMPAPLVGALLAGRRSGRADLRREVRTALLKPGSTLLLSGAGIMVWAASALALAWILGNVVGLADMGAIAGDVEAVRENIAAQLGAEVASEIDIPPIPALIAVTIAGGLLAGVTINGLLAFGEEYGWRGFLWDRLQGRGRIGTVGVIGGLWGLWHAPLILLVGFNYPEAPVTGVVMMVVFAVAASWPLDELRRASGSPVAPAIFHGALNGMAGLFILLSAGDRLLAPPVGVLGAVAMIPAALIVRRIASKLPDPESSKPLRK